MPAKYKFLDLVKATDVVPYPDDVSYQAVVDATYEFLSHDGVPIGRLNVAVADALKEESCFNIDEAKRTVQISTISSLDTFEGRNQLFKLLAEKWRTQNRFAVLQGWRDELYTVFNPSHTPYFLIERAAAALFGVITYGVHILGYVPPNKETGAPLRIWVPRRAETKATFPGMLDNTVAGGMGYPYGPSETAVKECYEEAGLSEDYVQRHIKPVGVVTYTYHHEYDSSSEPGLFQPEVEYIYDLEMDENTIPKPVDNEVAEFHLMTVEEIREALFAGKFKPNTALVKIDFFIRHGIITPENEADYMELQARTHRRMEYPVR